MSHEQAITHHYTRGDLVEDIRTALAKIGKDVDHLTVDDLAPVDEFHVGGRQASNDFFPQLPLHDQCHVLDLGCGIGGPARFMAERFGARVTGIDLTPEFIEAGQVLNGWVGLLEQVTLMRGSAVEPEFDDAHFDVATLVHVGMNIQDKALMFSEVARVLRPGGVFGIYDVMRIGEGELDYPVPWATQSATSFLQSVEDYKRMLQAAGFEVTAERNRRDFALVFFEEMRKRIYETGNMSPLGIHILMGETATRKIKNMVANINSGRIAPVELIARKL